MNFTSHFPGNQSKIQSKPPNNQTNNYSRKKFQRTQEQLPPLAIPLSEMYQRLLSIGQIALIPVVPLQPPFPQCYKPDQNYECHISIVGHNIDGCLAFKKKLL